MRTTFGLCLCLASACGFESHPNDDDEVDSNRPPVADDDMIATTANVPVTVDLLANAHDADNDRLAVTSFTQGAHGKVAVAGGVATYTPAPSYIGDDSFSYVVDDGRGRTDAATVAVLVMPGPPGCTISVSAPATGTFGQNLHLTADAACNTGQPQIQWYHKINSAYVVVQPYSASSTLDFAADVVGKDLFYATARAEGATRSQGASAIAAVKVADNTPQCTAVKMVSPVSAQTLRVNTPQTLTASATCPAGAVPEFQFWVKPIGAARYEILPGYTTTSASWAPPATGAWAVKAAVRSAGSHVSYQIASMSVTVTVTD